LATTVLTASGELVSFQIKTVGAAFAYNDSIGSLDVTGSTVGNSTSDRDLSGKRAIQKNAAERGSTGIRTTVSICGHNSKYLHTNSRGGHSMSKISHRMDSLIKA
jgi:hypothetical protein